MPSKRAHPLPPREERLRHQGKMLDEIMRHKRRELPERMRAMPLSTLRALAATVPDPLDFAAALRRPGVSLIAEVKRASPSRGLLCRDFDPAQLARTYVQGGAAAISVLTDARFFQGALEHLTTVKETVTGGEEARERREAGERKRGEAGAAQPTNLPISHFPISQSPAVPVLRKDFLFDPYQIVEARVAGADAVLLIVAVLGDHDLRHLLEETWSLGMEALVEVHDEEEVERALRAGARVIGVNNRDLRTFTVDLETTARLHPLIPRECVMVSESGIHGPNDVRRLREMGVDAMLVGESLVTAKPEERLTKVRELVRAGRG
ncbi:MAG: indole-3-glycerol phosphate synthase TrpC [Caldilineales bacterium]|nr:indole-3-glycerol phosphate synthase TrpC [Caldilineales bacterium]